MGTVYKGTGWGHSVIGETKDGTIYKGTGWGRTAIGEYKDGTIYKGTGWGRTAIGEYKDGTIYKGTGWGHSAVGEYKSGTENTKETLPEQQRCCCYNMSSSEITPKTLMSQSHNKIEPL